MTRKKLTKTQQWIKNNNRKNSKLKYLIPTLGQFNRMKPSTQRKYTAIMKDWQTNSPSRKGRALDNIFTMSSKIAGRRANEIDLGSNIIKNVNSLYFQQHEEYKYKIEEAPGDIYRQGVTGYYDRRRYDKTLGHVPTENHGKQVKGSKTAEQVGKYIIFKNLNRQAAIFPNELARDYLESVEFYPKANGMVAAIGVYRFGPTQTIEMYNMATETAESIIQDLNNKGIPSVKINTEELYSIMGNTTGW